MSARNLGFFTDLLPDEPLDSWLTAIARGMGTNLRSLLNTIGIKPTGAPYYLIRDLTADDYTRLCDWSGIDHDRLARATFDRWEPFGLKGARASRGIQPGAWPRNSGARACPECFLERQGRWVFEWYLQWSYVCVRHARPLLGACPTCGQGFKSTRIGIRPLATDEPVICDRGCRTAQWPDAPPSTSLERSIGDFSGRSAHNLEDDHPLFVSQQSISRILNDAAATVAGQTVPSHVWFNDLALLTKTFLTFAAAHGPRAAITRLAHPDDQPALVALVETVQPPSRASSSVQLALATAQPELIGTFAAIAADVLDEPDQAALTARTDRLARTGPGSANAQCRTSARSSPLIAALGGRGSINRSQRSAIQEALHAHPGAAGLILPNEVPARAPQAFLDRHPHGSKDLAPAAIATAILGLRPDQALADTTDLLGLGHLGAAIAHEWNRLLTSHGRELLDNITALRVAIRTTGSPIDYARRRHTYPEPLPLATRLLSPLAAETGATLTTAFKFAASLQVWERLTGSDALLTPQGLTLHGAFRMRYRQLRRAWNRQTPDHLNLLVEKALLKHRINEPITWEPTWNDHAWTFPTNNKERALPGWQTRQLRDTSRIHTRRQLTHATIEQVINLATTDTTAYANRVRAALTRLADIGGPGPGTAAAAGARVPHVAVQRLEWLATELGRPITKPHDGKSLYRSHHLTDFGAALTRAVLERESSAGRLAVDSARPSTTS